MCRLTIALGSGKWMLILMEQGVKVKIKKKEKKRRQANMPGIGQKTQENLIVNEYYEAAACTTVLTDVGACWSVVVVLYIISWRNFSSLLSTHPCVLPSS